MKKLWWLPVLFLIVSTLACRINLGGGEPPQATVAAAEISPLPPVASELPPTAEETALPTLPPLVTPAAVETQASAETALPTLPPLATATATEPPLPTATATATEPACPAYYTEEFDGQTDCWDTQEPFILTSIAEPKKVSIYDGDGRLHFQYKNNQEMYNYVFNANWNYPDVILEANVINLKGSTRQNGIALICHVNKEGWYELRASSDGRYIVYKFDIALKQAGKNPYGSPLAEGATAKISTGYDRVNTLRWECVGNTLTFSANGSQVWHKDFKEMRTGGAVGVGVTTFKDYFPVLVDFESVSIIEP